MFQRFKRWIIHKFGGLAAEEVQKLKEEKSETVPKPKKEQSVNLCCLTASVLYDEEDAKAIDYDDFLDETLIQKILQSEELKSRIRIWNENTVVCGQQRTRRRAELKFLVTEDV